MILVGRLPISRLQAFLERPFLPPSAFGFSTIVLVLEDKSFRFHEAVCAALHLSLRSPQHRHSLLSRPGTRNRGPPPPLNS